MAALYGYGRVSEQGFMGFDKDLQTGPWNEIHVPPALLQGNALTPDVLKLSTEQFWKLRVTRALTNLVRVYHGRDELSEADEAWDAGQRRFRNQTAVYLDARDPAKRAAAARIWKHMLMGSGGVEQTTLAYEKEIDFGRSQVFQASQEPIRSDIALLSMLSFIADIAECTEELARARGRGVEGAVLRSPSRRVRAAKSECIDAFSTIHSSLDWLIENAPDESLRDRWEAMRAPFVALLGRYPTEAGTPDEPDEEISPDTPDAPAQSEPS